MPTREQFEDAVFNKHFFAHISFKPNKQFADTEGQMFKHELCAKNDKGEYYREDVSAMWYGWNLYKKLLEKES